MNFMKKYIQKKEIIIRKKYFILFGKITSGFGSGKYYLNINYYKVNITKILKQKPYPGTLNIFYNNRDFLFKNIFLCNKYYIKSTYYNNIYLGGIKLLKCSINGIISLVIIPDINHHSNNTLEIVSKVNLRKKFNFENGNLIKIKIYY